MTASPRCCLLRTTRGALDKTKWSTVLHGHHNSPLAANCLASGEVEPIQIHDLVPCGHEVL